MTEPVNVTLDIASYGMPVPEFIDWIRGGLGGEFAKVADDIEAQVKPAVEEPTEFGSMVKATCTRPSTTGTAAGLFWVKIRGFWMDDCAGISRRWEELDAIEVLRIGAGAENPILDRLADSPTLEDARAEGYNDGVEATKSAAISLLLIKRERAITGERKDAYEKAIADIESIEALS